MTGQPWSAWGRLMQMRVEKLEQQEAHTKESHAELLAAFDAWFDVVAKDLGYEA